MTNQIALALGTAVLVLIGLDAMLNSGDALLFVARKLWVFIEWLAFWR